eukprot:GHVT01031288.1.p1 GENE.GHVT01031288.1~~GHVT01031288.1.p1  ORF type:complete len:175 (-),score=13.06 GHVT01031288.1:302-826(-)
MQADAEGEHREMTNKVQGLIDKHNEKTARRKRIQELSAKIALQTSSADAPVYQRPPSASTTTSSGVGKPPAGATAAKGVTDSVNQMRNELDSLVHAGLNDAVQQVVNKRSKPGDRNIELQKSHDTIRTPPKEERKKVKSEIARRISSAKVPDHQRPSSASTTTSSGFRKPPAGK